MMPLTMLNPGESASIVRVGGNEETKRFLENLGFVAGSEVKVISSNEGNIIAQTRPQKEELWIWESQKEPAFYVRKVAPLGDPVEVTVRGYELSLRKADAEMIEVK